MLDFRANFKAEISEYDWEKGLKVKTGNITKTYPNAESHVAGFIVGFFDWVRKNPEYYKIAFENAEDSYIEEAFRQYVDMTASEKLTPVVASRSVCVMKDVEILTSSRSMPYVYALAIASGDFERVFNKLVKYIVYSELRKEFNN